MRDPECVALLQWLLPRLEMRWLGFRKVRRQVCKRIDRRLRELRLPDAKAYQAYLEAHDEEWRVVDGFCRISISRFYRDRGVFDCLRDLILPELAALVQARGDDALCCWSAGCASGEEAYTLRMIWKFCIAPRFDSLPLHVLATDNDESMLERARQGCYPWSSLNDLPREWTALGFDRQADVFCIRDGFREKVDFLRQDIRQQMPQGPFHLILCRHVVFTYFAESLQRRVLTAMLERLIPACIFVTGKQELLPSATGGLLACGTRMGIYRRISSGDA